MSREEQRNQEATVYIGNLDERTTDSIIYELMLQAGPVVNIHLPKDRISQSHQGYGFAEFQTEADADYAVKIMNQIRLYGKPIRVNKASSDAKKSAAADIGAELFIGNLDALVDEKVLYDTFSSFGTLIATPKIARDEAGASKCFGFVSYDNFESADAAIEGMNNQFLMNKSITVTYAFKKDNKSERHGTEAERMLATQARKNNMLPAPAQNPATMFAGIAAPLTVGGPQPPMPSGFPGGPPGFAPNAAAGGTPLNPMAPGFIPSGPPAGFPAAPVPPPGYGAPPPGFGAPGGYPGMAPPAPPAGFGAPPMPGYGGYPGIPMQQGFPGGPPGFGGHPGYGR
ncbi:RNA-binding domain-containing protein [Saitoella complicata NRRL Y-17804]|uniref:RRM domain-containing protein n=1 Tax=Saitoella complicata (strain BCRC 22490 / CBS 7301 / JCM 7358 / NBRC 10748 / NRRL Y-17804) TaxID=698492 RepID=A0A0E9NGX7_SAICN|nr:RNA-binding domain-containing protein [Saitoella complicata NRRL Y-17804]ODQ51945.1 RNA-binding domain-containing protein [Saitoella complicata NRRL Y-17804]GAO48665.1 hypothetical protein G7K_2835-t1 [Saitoella complicata NRRL Y-17804]